MSTYDLVKQQIINTLMGRPVGTEIQPQNHQQYALSMLNYIQEVESNTNSILVGVAVESTIPQEPQNNKVSYISTIGPNSTLTFYNFQDEEGNPLTFTTGDNQAFFIVLLWNGSYWSSTSTPTYLVQQLNNPTYNYVYGYNIKQTYLTHDDLVDDLPNPIGMDGNPILAGELVTVTNDTDANLNGLYVFTGTNWKFQTNFNLGIDVVQTKGNSITAVMSQNAVSVEFNSTDRSLGGKVDINPSTENVIFDTEAEFKIADPNGNVVAMVDSSGLSVTNINLYNDAGEAEAEAAVTGNEVNNVYFFVENTSKYINTDFNPAEFKIADPNGNVVAMVDSNGIKSVNFIGKDGKNLGENGLYFGKELMTVGDSLCTTGYWQKRFCEILGTKFNNDINTDYVHPISFPGSVTYGSNPKSALGRISNLKDYVPDILILENINDYQAVRDNLTINGSISDEPFIISQFYYDGTKRDSWGVDYLNSIEQSNRKVGTVIQTMYNVNGIRFKLQNIPTSSGVFTLNVRTDATSTVQYDLNITAGQTLESIVNMIASYLYYGDVVCVKETPDTCLFSGGSGLAVTSTTSTGITSTSLSTNEAQAFTYYAFISRNINDWSDLSYWSQSNAINFYQSWKGILEWVQTNLPTTKVYIAGFPRFTIDKSQFTRPDGTRDIDAYNASVFVTKMNVLYTELKKIAEMYNVPFLEVSSKSGIGFYNVFEYYNEGNPHPGIEGYNRIGETISGLI